MSVEGLDFESVALGAATRDLMSPLVLLRQLVMELEHQYGGASELVQSDTLANIRLTVEQSIRIVSELQQAILTLEEMAVEPIQLAGLCQDIYDELSGSASQVRCQFDFVSARSKPIVAVGNYQALRVVLAGFLVDGLCLQPNSQLVNRAIDLKVGRHQGNQAIITINDSQPDFDVNQALQLTASPKVVQPSVSCPHLGTLNLWLADKLLQAMHGQLKIGHRRAGGATIRAVLPLSKQLSIGELTNAGC